MNGIRMEAVARSFSREKVVLSDVSFEIKPGEIVALTGANGSGKTTLLRILATLLLPSSGEAWVAGASVVKKPREARRALGWAAVSDGGFIPRFRGRENLEYFGALRGIPRSMVLENLRKWREVPALCEALETPFYLCSSGMKQTLSLCRALAHEPSVVVLDEPFRNVDLASTAAIEILLKAARDSGKSVLFSTHEAQSSSGLADRTLRLAGGRI